MFAAPAKVRKTRILLDRITTGSAKSTMSTCVRERHFLSTRTPLAREFAQYYYSVFDARNGRVSCIRGRSIMRKDHKIVSPKVLRARDRVTQADLGRVAIFLEAMGAKVALVDVSPGRMKILTTEGRAISVDTDDEELDRELLQYRQRRGEGTS